MYFQTCLKSLGVSMSVITFHSPQQHLAHSFTFWSKKKILNTPSLSLFSWFYAAQRDQEVTCNSQERRQLGRSGARWTSETLAQGQLNGLSQWRVWNETCSVETLTQRVHLYKTSVTYVTSTCSAGCSSRYQNFHMFSHVFTRSLQNAWIQAACLCALDINEY